MQQRQQTENGGGSGGVPRRSLMSPFAAQAGPPYQQQPLPEMTSFPHYPIPMEPSIRSYQHHQQPAQQMPPQGRYWQAPTGMDASSYAKQGRHGGSLDLGEFGGILDPDSTTGSNASATSGRTPSDAASEMSIAGFDVNSFHDGVTGSSGASGGWNPPVTTASMHSRPPATPTVPKKTRLATSKKSAEAIPPSSDAATTALVDAAYTQFSESNELDLRTDKLSKDRSERCQFPDCPNRARVSQSYGKYCNRHVIVAPCGFPGCRDKAMERASMCATHMEQGKEALQEILNARSQNVPVCKMSGCFKNDQGRGYCRGHEKLLMATGRLPPHINKRRLNSAYTMCSYPDCNKHSQRHHLCRTHGNLIIKQAQELADRPGATESYEEILGRLHKEIRRCTHENCSKNSQRDRLCTTHYYEKHHPQKDDSTSASTAKENGGLGKPRAGSSDGSDVRAVEGTHCGKPGCGNLSYTGGLCVEHAKEIQNLPQNQGRYGDPFPSGENTGLFSDDVDSETKPGVFVLDEKPQATGVPLAADMSSTANITHSKCANPMCDRESYGRDYCEACQRLFSPLVVSINPSSSGYPLNSPSVGVDQPEGKILLCRVSSCGQDSVRGGLCSTHLRAFRTGSLSVDNLKLNSQAQQLQREQELAEAAAVAATAAEAKLTSPSASGKARKYYCRVDGCSKQAQKRNLCKRHYRLQEGVPTGKSYPEASSSGPLINFAPGLPQTGFASPTMQCQYPSCSQVACGGTLLCLAHSKATFCWQPGCENLVGHQQFCEFHAFRQQCAYEGCMYGAERNYSGCANHAMARKCRHDFCDKFAVGSDSDWCRLHQISCQDAPCVLCKLHALPLNRFAPSENENTNRSRYNANLSTSTSKGLMSGGGGNPFGRNPRMM
ncbi:hypothetical protein PC110_g6286 [Phytophthora cactorum]|uniref:Uncharacterized protein n=1 Tax=Phytophthora cactorum TaxID=29920 RepID=A0A329SKV7_9STRA|nr:hypothetical protein PC117_g3827 [Phytophthora cactorum]KAG3203497.1 hypothetical protein PC128_g2524 [Phytophthora cactorum]RAW37454.1 hypothetical protein PC110_g6286 [Phytophthora cactorum]